MDESKRLSEYAATFQVGLQVTNLESSHAHLETSPDAVAGYVPQRVRVDGSRKSVRIVLLAAPGAVGKSAAARWIANNRRWFYVDAARMQVGDHGLTGLLRKALTNSSAVFGSIERGEVGFVVDALDEALIRSNVDSLFAFIEDVVSLSAEQRGTAINTVLVARDDVADLIRLKLDELGVQVAVARLDYFDLDAALQMLGWLAQGGPLDRPKRQLAESRMKQIGSAVLGQEVVDLGACWSMLEGFLGYAPVLAILASGLDVDNPYREFTSGTRVPAAKVLLELVEALLAREQQKFVGAKGTELHARCAPGDDYQPDLIFSPIEQARRLYGQFVGTSFDRADSPVSDTLWPHYRDAAEQWLLDHPFKVDDGVASQVFKDFVLARAASDHIGALKRDIGDVVPGRFFAPFVHEFCGARVPEWLVGWLLNSTGSAVSGDREWEYSQSGNEAVLILPDPLGTGELAFKVEQLSGYLELSVPGMLGGGTVISDQSVEIGCSGELVLFGGLLVMAPEIVVAASALQVAPSGAFLMAGREGDASRVGEVRLVGNAGLHVQGFSPWPLLRPYEMRVASEDIETIMQAPGGLADLRALLRPFRKSVHDPRAALSVDRMNSLVAHNDRRRAYLDSMVDSGFLERAGSAYFLSNDALSGRGISFEALSRGQMDRHVFSLLVDLEKSRRAA